jgi:hypothetical protein
MTKMTSKKLSGIAQPWSVHSPHAMERKHCLGAGCTEWSIKTVRAFADAFSGRLKIQPNYQRVDFGTP